ncbi:MAG: YfhO family protein, partial [Cyclobacteriaceae bacterium]
MIKIDFQNQVLPHLVAVAVFLLITVLFYSPIFFENKNVNQNDVLQGLGSGQEIRDYRDATGEEALWTNSMFGGMPAYLINTRWSGDLLSPLRHGLSLWLPSPASVTFASMLCFYFMLLVFGVRPYLAIAGSIAFGLGSF